VKRRSALDACESLERAAAASLRAELATAARCADDDRLDDREMLTMRSGFARLGRWTADSCAFVHLRAVRSTIDKGRRSGEAANALRRAATHDAQRVHWATLVRGLQRREARRRERDGDHPCPA